MKRIYGYCLAIVFVLALLFVTSSSAEIIHSGTCGTGVSWKIDENGVLDIYSPYDEGIISSHPWTAADVRIVNIQDGIAEIGASTFQYCSNLIAVNIPDSVKTIKTRAFYNCSNLKEIYIPDEVTSISAYAFYGCSSLTNVIMNGASWIYDYAFSGCSSLKSVDFSDYLTYIGNHAFANSGLKYLSTPNNWCSIDDYAFYNCRSLSSVILSDFVDSIGNNAFSGCGKLTNITIPSSVESIGDFAFSNCTNLTKIAFLHDINSGISISNSMLNKSATIYCYKYSEPENWAANQGYPICLLDEMDINDLQVVDLGEDYYQARLTDHRLDYMIFPYGSYIYWSSSDENVATVYDGVVEAHYPGTADITAWVGGASDTVTVNVYIPVESFSLNVSEATLATNQTKQLSISNIQPLHAKEFISWRSSNTTLATVNSNGVVTARKAGNVTIYAEDINGATQQALIHIYSPVASVELIATDSQISVGSETQLTAYVTTKDSQIHVNEYVVFTSDNTILAEVDENGIVTALHPGIVTLTATSNNGISGSTQIEITGGSHIAIKNNDIPPTCLESGYMGGTHCEICGCIIDEPEETPALGHDWDEPSYVWSDDNSQVTATRMCIRDKNHIETETVSTTFEVTQEGTCIEAGKRTYTSGLFQNEAFEVQIKDTDYFSSHKLISHARTGPTCTEYGHKAYYECSVCGKLFQGKLLTPLTAIPYIYYEIPLGHEWGTPVYNWDVSNKKVTAMSVCTRNGEHIISETVNIAISYIVSPTKTKSGKIVYISDAFSNDEFEIKEKDVIIPSLNEMSTIYIPSNVKIIESESFRGGNFQAVIIPDTCISIEYQAFADCPNLVYVLIPDSVVSIDEDAFARSNQVVLDIK